MNHEKDKTSAEIYADKLAFAARRQLSSGELMGESIRASMPKPIDHEATNRKQAAVEAEKRRHYAIEEESIARLHENLRIQTSLAVETLTPALNGSLCVLAAQINRWMRHQGFWQSENVGEKLALIHSEVSEAMEADRKGLASEHLPGFSGVEEEMADIIIRVLDFCYHNDLRLTDAIRSKMNFNLSRPHMHGKKY